MNLEEFRAYCLQKKGVEEGMPFGDNVLVFKVMGKLFALTDIDQFESVNLKCDPEYAVTLREEYDGSIIPGYHMNKKHWNTVMVNSDVSDQLLLRLTDESYELVVKGLTKKARATLHSM